MIGRVVMRGVCVALGWVAWLLPAMATADTAGRAARDDPAFWRTLAEHCVVPEGDSAVGLVREAVGFLGSTDPVWRDEVGYGVVASCVYGKRLLGADERNALVDVLMANMQRGIGQVGDDSVLLRSFSALDLSIFAALELQQPVLDEAGYRRLLNAALVYLRDERDLRGFESRVGWIHATAHTADLLKFLARDPRFSRSDQSRLLEAVWVRMTASSTPVFTHAEDERLAAAALSVVRRTDFEVALMGPWLERFVQLEKATWSATPPQASALATSQNARNLLKSLYVLSALPAPEPTAGQEAARAAVQGTLQQIRR
ncbi:MAG: DUF2785 domain-containing protein [Steroidobacteraceae bacterium]|nr:DUF2785 domain-containing protein [Steroidobacteraceae bacterium]